jgi:hypothetical protein
MRRRNSKDRKPDVLAKQILICILSISFFCNKKLEEPSNYLKDDQDQTQLLNRWLLGFYLNFNFVDCSAASNP